MGGGEGCGEQNIHSIHWLSMIEFHAPCMHQHLVAPDNGQKHKNSALKEITF